MQLRTCAAEIGGGAHSDPWRCRLRRVPAQFADRGCGVGDAAKLDGAMARYTANKAEVRAHQRPRSRCGHDVGGQAGGGDDKCGEPGREAGERAPAVIRKGGRPLHGRGCAQACFDGPVAYTSASRVHRPLNGARPSGGRQALGTRVRFESAANCDEL